MENQVLAKLVDNLDDVKERLIRIEENVKRITDIQNDVDNLKIASTQHESSGKSAHKRLDSLENNQTWLWRTVIGAIIVGAISLLFAASKGGI